jgi:hypothetical protein
MENKMTPEQFPILLKAAGDRRRRQFVAALGAVDAAIDDGAIRNVVLGDIKSILSRIIDDAWDVHVNEPFFYAGRWENQTEEVNALSRSITVSGLHDVLSTSKKVARSKVTGEAVDAMRAFTAEVLPLAQVVASLKDMTIKGRAPSTAPAKPENPDKVVKTCPCCFRTIAVHNTMVHHGYERPGSGWQTASCPGVRFQPLEVSSEGLEWLIGTVTEDLRRTKATYDERGMLTVVPVTVRGKKTTVTKDHPEWKRAFAAYENDLVYAIRGLERELPPLLTLLRDWKPEEVSVDEPETGPSPGGCR